jgi:hypothetical protein
LAGEKKSGGKGKLRVVLILLAVLAVPVLAALGVEAWRQNNENSSIDEVQQAYDDTVAYFGNPDDWDQYFRTRRKGTCGYDQFHDWGRNVKKSGIDNQKVRTWTTALLQDSAETPPTDEEAEGFLRDSRPLVGEARKLLKYDYLDGASTFNQNGETSGNLEGLYGMRVLQLRTALLAKQGDRDAAMNELELLLGLTTRLQQPLGIFEFLIMNVVEPDTMLAAGRLAESGPLPPACRELIRNIAKAPEARVSIAEGELAVFAWRYHQLGIESLAAHSKGSVRGGSTGWFHWFGESGFTGAADLNRQIAAEQRAMLDYCEDLQLGRKPNPNSQLPIGLESNFSSGYSALHLQRDRMVFVIRLRDAMESGNPASLNADVLKAGMILDKQEDGWTIGFKGDKQQLADVKLTADSFKKSFPSLYLRR